MLKPPSELLSFRYLNEIRATLGVVITWAIIGFGWGVTGSSCAGIEVPPSISIPTTGFSQLTIVAPLATSM
jgi:hypothetical protein